MSMSGWDSDSSSSAGPADHKSFRQISKERLLHEMLRSTKGGKSKAAWKVLIMDNITTKVMSYCCKMSHITDEGVSSVENLYKRRQPLPSMEAIYFILPSKENISIFLSDMSGKSPLYKKAYVFFSSPVPRELVAHIKSDSKVRPRIGALCEMNLEYIAIDRQAFITDHESALEDLFGENIDNSHKYNDCLNTMARRIATVFVSMKEFPNIHYRAAKSSVDASTMTTLRDLFPTKLAAGVWNCLIKYKTTIPNFPQKETCELLIIDRSIDQIVPVIHEWTYDAMCHDLLNMNGNKYVQEVTSNSGVVSKKEVLLEEHDPLWAELRHCHIADASERLHDKMTDFLSKNKAAQVYHDSRNGSELSTRDLQKMVQALPQYSEQIDRLSLHVEIAGKINKIIRETGLRDLGQLEQDLVFGDAGTKEVINFLKTKEEISSENKMRLLMIYAAIYQDKFDGERFSKLMQLARLSSDDMKAVINMRYLADPSSKKTSRPGFSFKFDSFRPKKHATRKERDVEGTWALSRFYPLIEDLIEKVSKDELPKHEYSCINGPSSSFHLSPSVSVRSTQVQPSQSMRSRRIGTWARPRNSDDGYSSDSVLKHASSDFKKMGRRVFIFLVGGATRSELRAIHKLTTKLNREIILGSTSIDDPPQFIKKMKKLSGEDLSLDELHI